VRERERERERERSCNRMYKNASSLSLLIFMGESITVCVKLCNGGLSKTSILCKGPKGRRRLWIKNDDVWLKRNVIKSKPSNISTTAQKPDPMKLYFRLLRRNQFQHQYLVHFSIDENIIKLLL
jgi:hypothetical protein